MSLREIAFGAALAFTGSCATVKPVCDYLQNVGHCTTKYNNATVDYNVRITDEGAQLCSINATYPDDKFAFNLLDIGCDGVSEAYITYHTELGQLGLEITTRDMKNEESNKFFSDLDKLFEDRAFQKLKKKVLGDKK